MAIDISSSRAAQSDQLFKHLVKILLLTHMPPPRLVDNWALCALWVDANEVDFTPLLQSAESESVTLWVVSRGTFESSGGYVDEGAGLIKEHRRVAIVPMHEKENWAG